MPMCVCTGSDTLVLSGRSSCPAAALDAPARVHTKRNSLQALYRGRADSVGVMVAAHRQLLTVCIRPQISGRPQCRTYEAPRGPLRLAPWDDHWHRSWLEETGPCDGTMHSFCFHAFTPFEQGRCVGPSIVCAALRQEPSLCAHEPQLNKTETGGVLRGVHKRLVGGVVGQGILGAREPQPFLRIDSGDLAEAEATSSCKRAECHFRVLSSEGLQGSEGGWLAGKRSVHAFFAAAATSSAVAS